jgi:8-oxo-dGTP pyrophosphatase MutT (NUDIX family)
MPHSAQPSDLFDIYPELRTHFDQLCQGARWCMTGVSALAFDQQSFYFEITKPKHWRVRADGTHVAGIGGIGGSLEPSETLLGCLARELAEELGATGTVASSAATYLIYEQRVAAVVPLEERAYPRPVLFTISQNLYRRAQLPDCAILAIATFMVRLHAPPVRGDLFGLVAVPHDQLAALFAPDELTVGQARALPGIDFLTQEPVLDTMVLVPVWTGRSYQLLHRAGCL